LEIPGEELEDELTLEQAAVHAQDDSEEDLSNQGYEVCNVIMEPPSEKAASVQAEVVALAATGRETGSEAGSAPLLEPDERRPALIKVNVVGIRFGYACKVYHFDAGDMELAAGDWVIVKTEKGTGLGHIALAPFERLMDASQLEGLRKVVEKQARWTSTRRSGARREKQKLTRFVLSGSRLWNCP